MSNHQITFIFEDEVSKTITSQSEETILDAAYRQGIMLPMDCRDGVCHTCRSVCRQGQYSMPDDIAEEMVDEYDDSTLLTCATKPQSNCVIEIPIASTKCNVSSVKKSAAKISQMTRLSDNIFSMALTLSDAEGLNYTPGQYCNIIVPGTTIGRSFSFTSYEPEAKQLNFLIRLNTDGLMSAYLTSKAKVGDTFTIEGPHGVFYLRETKKKVFFLAGGTGLAPFLSILDDLKKRPSWQTPLTLKYGVKHYDDLVCTTQLEDYAQTIPHFSYETIIEEEDARWEKPRGYVTDLITEDLNSSDIYICGPGPMVTTVQGLIRDQGGQDVNLYLEKF